MRFSRARYVTLCQQSLVTATVLVVGLSAAGVKTLDIVPAPARPGETVLGPRPATVPAPEAVRKTKPVPAPPKAEVVTEPVTPQVREIKVAPRTQPQKPADTSAPKQSTQAPSTTPVVAESTPQRVTGYATVGVTWKPGFQVDDEKVSIEVRTQKAGRWSGWMPVEYHDEHAPDADPGELRSGARPGTDALVIGDVDQVQMRAENADGKPIPDLKLAVIDPGTASLAKQRPAIDTAALPGGKAAAGSAGTKVTAEDGTEDTVQLSAMRVAPKPTIYSRAQWGANERMREPGLPSYGTVRAGFIHHTVNANTYTSAQVPALLRGIYAYHTQSRGWRDIGYNFLVDRFGRIWEGRFGGVDRAVVGAHTQGYNEVSFSMSALGNYETARPTTAVLNAYARLFAWKLSMYNVRADTSRVYLKNRYVQAISGHRDAGSTACPGRYLYAQLPAIRVLTQRIQNGAGIDPPPPTDPNAMTSPTQAPLSAAAQPGSMSFPRSLNLAGDSAPDLVLHRRDGSVVVLPTGGQAGYRRPVSTPGNWGAYSLVAAVGDVTGDGRGDVLVRARSGVSGILAGDGYGRVRGPMLGLTPRFRYADLVLPAGDWNRDRRGDVIIRDRKSGYLYLVQGAGRGRFGKARLISRWFRNFSSVAVVGDLTRDGRTDVVGLHRNGYLYLARGLKKKKGKLAVPIKRGRVSARYAIVGGARDLTGDGYGDLVLRAPGSGRVSILPGRTWGWFGRPLGSFGNVPYLSRLSSANMAGSSAADLVGVSGDGRRLLVVPHNGMTNMRALLRGNVKQGGISQVLNVGDWNRDGRGDIITRQSGGDALVLRRGFGNGTFATGLVMARGWRSFTRLAAVGDVTGDGRPDLMGRRSTGNTVIFPGNGRTGFNRPVTAANYVRTFNQIGDGFWKPQMFSTATFLGANGTFTPYRGTGVGVVPGYNWVFGPGDVDGDGKADLVARDSAGTLWLLPGTTSGVASRRLIGEGFAGYTLGG